MTSVSILFLLQSTNYGSSDHVGTVLDPAPDLHPTTQPTDARDDPDAYVEKLTRHWAKGPRLDFLSSHITGYQTASMAGASRAQQYLDSVVNAYFSKFPWRLKVSENPTTPASEQLNSMENLSKVEMEQKQRKVTAMRKAIKSWLEYRIRANRKVGGNVVASENNMWTRLLVQLSGVSKKKPKALQAHQRWSKDHFDTIVRPDFQERCNAQGIKGKAMAQTAIAEWTEALSNPPATDPVSRQSAIDRLPSFAGPLLSGMHAILGMHVTLIVGGPEPRKDGNITVLSMHEGGDKSSVPRNWQAYDKAKYRAVTHFFHEYLDTCYSKLYTCHSPESTSSTISLSSTRRTRCKQTSRGIRRVDFPTPR
ncbi:hypothetical protein BKA82DRAFT_153352 [Pisolithus tinctorius]|nr:hypothetical protein BKA82DRAFT_153352 [Pisolithus tinctorius]